MENEKISNSGRYTIDWLHLFPFSVPEVADELRECGIFEGGVACVHGPSDVGNGFQVAFDAAANSATLWIPLSGNVEIQFRGGSFRCGPGDLLIRPLYIRHRVVFRDDRPFTHIYFRRHAHKDEDIRMAPFPEYAWCGQLAERIYHENLSRRRLCRDSLRYLTGLMRVLLQRVESVGDPGLGGWTGLIIRHPEELWTTSKLARKLKISDSLLYKRCIEYYHKPPSEVIAELKMRLADELLIATDRNLEEIARQLGYSSAFAFSKAYRKVTGCRPGARRRRQSVPDADGGNDLL